MTKTAFYRLLADPEAVSRWHLASPTDARGRDVDPRLFTQGTRILEKQDLFVPLRRAGDVVLFNFADFDMVITPAGVNAQLEAIAPDDIQRIPVTIGDRSDEFEILNVCRLVSCLDEGRSEFLRWTAADGRPEKVGEFRMIAKLVIQPRRASKCDIFRIAEWPIALVVSDRVKQLLERLQVSGLKYQRVC